MSRPTAAILREVATGKSYTTAARIVGRRGGMASAQRRREKAQREAAALANRLAFERHRAARPDLYE